MVSGLHFIPATNGFGAFPGINRDRTPHQWGEEGDWDLPIRHPEKWKAKDELESND